MEQDEKSVLVEKFQKRLEGKNVPEDIMKVINDEMVGNTLFHPHLTN